MVLPGAGKGDSITLLMNGYTSAAEIPLLRSTSSRICNKRKQNKLMGKNQQASHMQTATGFKHYKTLMDGMWSVSSFPLDI